MIKKAVGSAINALPQQREQQEFVQLSSQV